jgi:nucleotide-binding universal stress UspA family protein
MITELVVPLDGSEFAATAIPAAMAIASRTRAGLRFVGIARDEGERATMHDELHEAARQATTTPAPEVDVIVDVDPTGRLLEIATQQGVVLCFASHDRMGVATHVLHSVGSAIMARARHPFVVVGTLGSRDDATDIVVALDGVGDPRPLLDTAIPWARQLAAPLRLVTVFEPVPEDIRRPSHFTRSHGPPGDPDEYLATLERNVGANLATVSTASIGDPVSVSDGLAHHLAERPAGLLVVGGGRHEHPHLHGGVTRHLLREVAVPLLVVNRH